MARAKKETEPEPDAKPANAEPVKSEAEQADAETAEAPVLMSAPKADSAVAAPVRRGPGRPRKNPLAEVPVRRGPGRPRKNQEAFALPDEEPKRRPGRPRKVALDINERMLRVERRLDHIIAELGRVYERVCVIGGGAEGAAAVVAEV
jgi:hypothetical protein